MRRMMHLPEENRTESRPYSKLMHRKQISSDFKNEQNISYSGVKCSIWVIDECGPDVTNALSFRCLTERLHDMAD